jgi:hypothetical protein
MSAKLRFSRGGLLLAAALFASACSDPSGPPVPASLEANGVIPGTAMVGSAVTPAVLVSDSRGRPVAGATVTFAVTAGGGSVANATGSSNAEGIATPGSWTLGTTAGANTLVANFGALAPVTITINGTAGAPVAIAPLAGNPTTGTVGALLTTQPGVRVTDQFGNPVSGVQVTFTPAASSGSVSGGVQNTGASGEARPGGWTLGQTEGTQTLNVSAGALATAIMIQATTAPPSALERLSAVSQWTPAGQPVSEPPSVRVEDAAGNPVAGATVTFTVTSGGGSVSGGTQMSDALGIATVGSWTLGPTPGTNTLTAAVRASVTAGFTATGLDASGLSLEKFAGDNTTCPINRAGCVFSVRVMQAGNQPAANQTVVWSNGTGALVNTVTNIRGIATAGNIAPNTTVGDRTQTATLQTSQTSEAAVTFDYALVPDAGYNIVIRYIGSTPTAAVQAAFTAARDRWQEVITGDLTDILLQTEADQCGTHPPFDETIDDLLILVVVDSIDGPGDILGSAGPCYIRNSNALPLVGRVLLDSADLAEFDDSGVLESVILHEVGHTLGFPALWGDDFFALLQDSSTSNPYYNGARGGADFVVAGGTLVNHVGVPVEDTGGGGTRNSHWRESVMSTELMTGFISGSNTPLSRITIGSLMDIGYQVNFGAADAYLLPGASLRGAWSCWNYRCRRRASSADAGRRLLAPPRVVR